MSNGQRETRGDVYTRFCLGAILVLLAALTVGVWAQQDVLPSATAAAPGEGSAEKPFGDAAGWRDATIKGQADMNSRLDELIRLLKSGEVKVQVADAPKK
jgi:hypothetical protein